MIVYQITNVDNGKRYIGVTEMSLSERWRSHRKSVNRGVKTALYNAIRLHGIDRFICEEMAAILPGFSRKTLGEIERVIIAQEGTLAPGGYNMTPGGDGMQAGENCPLLGIKRSDETRAKIKAGWTPERRAKLAEKSAATLAARAARPNKRLTPEYIQARDARCRLLGKNSESLLTNEQRTARNARLVAYVRSPEGREASRLRMEARHGPDREIVQ